MAQPRPHRSVSALCYSVDPMRSFGSGQSDPCRTVYLSRLAIDPS